MIDSGFHLMDCMDAMREFPDKFFDLAIVDPVYGDVTKGGYMTHNNGQRIGKGLANQKGYYSGLWCQKKTPPEYFEELMRVSVNQIIWGGELLLKYTTCFARLDCLGQAAPGWNKVCRLRTGVDVV